MMEVNEIILDEEFYPRKQPDWMTAYQYQKAMQAGNRFPPILVGQFQDKYYAVDGWHRIVANKNLKRKEILAMIRHYSNKKDMFLDAIKTNSRHGKQFTPFDKMKMLIRAKDFHIEQVSIARIVGIPFNDLKQFIADRIAISSTGQEIPLSGTMRQTWAGREMTKKAEEAMNHISGFAGGGHSSGQLIFITELYELIESNSLDMKDKKVMNAIVNLFELIKRKLDLK